jgi:hypothetical protein
MRTKEGLGYKFDVKKYEDHRIDLNQSYQQGDDREVVDPGMIRKL